MKLSLSDPRWAKYNAEPNSGEYKGFKLKGSMKERERTGEGLLTFTNGEDEFSVSGASLEDAFIKMFDTIDEFHK